MLKNKRAKIGCVIRSKASSLESLKVTRFHLEQNEKRAKNLIWQSLPDGNELLPLAVRRDVVSLSLLMLLSKKL